MDTTAQELKPLPPILKNVRLVALVLLVLSIPLAGFVGVKVPGAVHQKKMATLALFDVLIWVCLAVVVLCRFMRGGAKGVLRMSCAAPLAAWCLIGLSLWSGIIWPRCSSALDPVGMTSVAKSLLPLVEYGILGFIVFGELVAGERERRAGLLALSIATGVALIYGGIQYFGSSDVFYVGSFFGGRELFSGGNRNALGAFLAVSVPFFAVMAVGSRAWEWRVLYAVLAAVGVLLVTSGGAVLAIVCGALLGAVLLGKRQGGIIALGLVVLLGLGQVLPRENLRTGLDSIRVTRACPKDSKILNIAKGEPLLALRYVRAGAEINVLRAPLREIDPVPGLFFGFGPGGYDRTKRLRPQLRERPAGQTDNLANFDVLANEPNTFNLFGVAAAELGLLGLICFLWLFAACGRRCLEAWKKAPEDGLEKVLALAALAAVVGGTVVSPFSSVWIRGSGPLLVMLVAFASAVYAKDAITTDTPN